MLRFALCESIAIVSVALAFVVGEGGFVTYLVGAVVSLALMSVHVWPSRRTVGRTEDALEWLGARTGLREAFGLDPRGGGAVQEL